MIHELRQKFHDYRSRGSFPQEGTGEAADPKDTVSSRHTLRRTAAVLGCVAVTGGGVFLASSSGSSSTPPPAAPAATAVSPGAPAPAATATTVAPQAGLQEAIQAAAQKSAAEVAAQQQAAQQAAAAAAKQKAAEQAAQAAAAQQKAASGQEAVSAAEHLDGTRAINVVMPNYVHAGGIGNDCADFVTSDEINAHRLPASDHQINVGVEENMLEQQDWHIVPASQSQPGDIWIENSDVMQHTMIVAKAGGELFVGSNGSIATGGEVVGTTTVSPGFGVIFAPPASSGMA